jgi:hypothetical protein
MAVGGITEAIIGVKAERTSLEDIANPLSLVGRASQSISDMRDALQQGGGRAAPAAS